MRYIPTKRVKMAKTQAFFLLLLLLPVFLSCKKETVTPTATNTSIDTGMVFTNAENAHIRYSGRIDFSNPKAPKFWFPGISIKATFQGPSIDIVLKDYATGGALKTNYYNVFIDQQLHMVLQINTQDTLYKIARNLSDANHTIEIFKRTESQVGASSFKGFCLQINKNLIAMAAAKPSRKIEFIGDSYTCGYGNEVSIAAPPSGNPDVGFHSINENNYTGWGAIVARDLNAEYHCTAYSGRGVYRNNTGSTTGVLASIYNRINPDNASPAWNTDNFIPDVIVIHLGTNDFAPEQSTPPNMVDSAKFVNAYISLVTTLRGYYPSAKIMCVRPNSLTDYYPVGLKALTRITSYTKAVVNHFADTDPNVFYFALTPQVAPYGEDWHPSAATHVSMAAQIKPFIKTNAGW